MTQISAQLADKKTVKSRYRSILKPALLALASIALFSCSGASEVAKKILGSSSKNKSKVFILIPDQLSSSRSAQTQNSITYSNGTILPTGLSEFNCIAVNVVASDIPTARACGGQATIGANSGFVPRGNLLEVDVTTGRNRTFQIWGFANATSCPKTTDLLTLKAGQVPGGATGPAYLLAQKSVDIMEQTATVNMTLSFNLTTSTPVCGSVPAPDTTISYAKVSPAEVTTFTNGTTTTDTSELCIGFTTTAQSPQYTCYQDGVSVSCAQGACASLSGGTVHLFTGAPLASGTHTFRVETTDLLYGLSDPTPATFTWTVDNAVPTLSINSISPGGYSAGDTTWYTKVTNPSVFLTVSEAGTLRYSVNAGANINCATPSFAGSVKCSISGLTSGAANTVVFSEVDSAGNTSANLSLTFTVDTSAPTLTLAPSNFWLMGGYLNAATSPDGAIPTATDPTLGVIDTSTLVCSVDSATYAACPASLTFSDGGRHSVAMQVNDYAGNLTTFSNYVWIDSLSGQTGVGRLQSDRSFLSDESALTTIVGNQPLDNGISSPGQTAIDTSSGYFYVADTGNNRVLVFPWDSNSKSISSNHAVAVFGQSDFTSSDSGTTNTATYTPMSGPVGVALSSSPKKLFVADTTNNRVLRFDISTGNANKLADVIFGQTSDVGNNFNIASTLSTVGGANLSNGLYTPTALAYDSVGDRLFVTDTGNCRVAVFGSAANTATSGNNMSFHVAANGQTLAGTWNCAVPDAASDKTLNNPLGIWLDASASKLYVADNGNNRVAVWDTSTMAASPTADISTAMGQTLVTTSTAGDGSTAPSMTGPIGVAIATDSSSTKHLAVSLYSGSSLNKVKFLSLTSGAVEATWNSSGTQGASKTALKKPGHLLYDSTAKSFYVSDILNHRVGVFPFTKLSTDISMNDVIGHSTYLGEKSFAATLQNNPNDEKLNGPTHSIVDSTRNRLYVSDTANNRILVYALDPSTKKPSSTIATAVIGTPLRDQNGNTLLDTNTSDLITNSASLYLPGQLALDSSGNLWVADTGNSRVLKFLTGTTSVSSQLKASIVLGQASFSTRTTGATATTMNSPRGIAYDATADRLFVADTSNSRVLVFTSVETITSNSAASSTIGSNGTDLDKFATPEALYYTQGISGVLNKGLFVTDRNNHRVMYFDFNAGVPTQASACYGHHAATVTLMCQTSNVDDGGTLATNGTYGLNSPQGVWLNETAEYLYISDTTNSRVVVYDLATVTNRPSGAGFSTGNTISHVMGADDFLSNKGASTATSSALKAPTGIFGLTPTSGSNLLYISDPTWHRVGVYEVP